MDARKYDRLVVVLAVVHCPSREPRRPFSASSTRRDLHAADFVGRVADGALVDGVVAPPALRVILGAVNRIDGVVFRAPAIVILSDTRKREGLRDT